MASTKADIAAKVKELQTLAMNLPSGDGKIALEKLAQKLNAVAHSGLKDDGSTDPNIAQFVPKGGLGPNALSDGDGHAVTCC